MTTITIEHIASIIAENVFPQLAYDPDFDTLQAARQINEGDGFIVVTSAPLGNTLRTEGVRVDDATLVKAHERARQIVEG